MKKQSTVEISVRMAGGGWTARAGRGKNAKIASSTSCENTAAYSAACKYFGRLSRRYIIRIRLKEQGTGVGDMPYIFEAKVVRVWGEPLWACAAKEAAKA